MSIGKNNTVIRLQEALFLPGAELTSTPLLHNRMQLWLMQLENPLQTLNTQQIGAFWQQLPYWAFAWAGGQALAQWILDHPQQVKGKRVLDFGCGSGIVAVAAALSGAQQVWVADLDPHALLAAQENARLNGVEVVPVSGDWPAADLLLAADVLYDISSSDDLRRLILSIPDWLLAESRCVAPDFARLSCLQQGIFATLPAIGDFDEAVEIGIYCRHG